MGAPHDLAFTGTDVVRLLTEGFVLLIVGSGLVLVGRRRQRLGASSRSR